MVSKLCGNKKGKSLIQEINGKLVGVDKVDGINKFFAQIGPTLDKAIPPNLSDGDDSFNGNREYFTFLEVTPIQDGKSTGFMVCLSGF